MIKIKIAIAILLFLSSCHSNNKNNTENLKLIELGMTEKDVREIMGEPNMTFIFPLDSLRYSYMYESPFGYSDNFYIFFDARDSIVVDVGDGL